VGRSDLVGVRGRPEAGGSAGPGSVVVAEEVGLVFVVVIVVVGIVVVEIVVVFIVVEEVVVFFIVQRVVVLKLFVLVFEPPGDGGSDGGEAHGEP